VGNDLILWQAAVTQTRFERLDVDDLVLGTKGRVEAEFRQPARQRHLSAFEASPVLITGTRARAVRAASRGLAASGAFAPAHALTGLGRPTGGTRIAECHCQFVYW